MIMAGLETPQPASRWKKPTHGPFITSYGLGTFCLPLQPIPSAGKVSQPFP